MSSAMASSAQDSHARTRYEAAKLRKTRRRKARRQHKCKHKSQVLLPAHVSVFPKWQCKQCGLQTKCRQGPRLWAELVAQNRDPVGIFAIRLAKHRSLTGNMVGSNEAAKKGHTKRGKKPKTKDKTLTIPRGYTSDVISKHAVDVYDGVPRAISRFGTNNISAQQFQAQKLPNETKAHVKKSSPTVARSARASALRHEGLRSKTPIVNTNNKKSPFHYDISDDSEEGTDKFDADKIGKSCGVNNTDESILQTKHLGATPQFYDISDDSYSDELDDKQARRNRRRAGRHARRTITSAAEKWRVDMGKSRRKQKVTIRISKNEKASKSCIIS